MNHSRVYVGVNDNWRTNKEGKDSVISHLVLEMMVQRVRNSFLQVLGSKMTFIFMKNF